MSSLSISGGSSGPHAPDGTAGETIGAERHRGLLGLGESLRNGIWPRSTPLWMAAFYTALFIVRPWEELLPWLGMISFERIYALAMIAVVTLTCGFRFRLDLLTTAVLFFLACMGASTITAWKVDLAWDTFYGYVTIVIFYFVLISVVETPYQLVFMVTTYIEVMAVYLAKALWEFFVHGQHRFDQDVIRLCGIESTFGGPNMLAKSIVISLPMLWFLHSVRMEFTESWPAGWRKWYLRSLKIYLALAMVSLVLTNSRSGMLSFVVFVVLIALWGRGIGRKLMYLLVVGMFLPAIWFVLPAETQGRLRTIWDPSSGPKNAQASAEGREVGFWAGMEIFKRFPITGVGIGNFQDYRERHVDGIFLQAHNLPGQLLGEMGLLGVAGFLLLGGALFLTCRRLARLAGRSDFGRLGVFLKFAVATRIAVILLLFEGLSAHNLYRFNWLWLAAFSGLALRFTSCEIETWSDVPDGPLN